MYIMWFIIFEEKAEVQDQYPLSMNPGQKADDPIQDRTRSIGPLFKNVFSPKLITVQFTSMNSKFFMI